MASDDVRYGVSLLDMKYRKNAQDDEVLINGNNGKVYYKRPDGQIVTSFENYTKDSLYAALGNIGAVKNYNGSDFIIYNTIDISGLTNLTSDAAVSLSLDKTFPLSQNEQGFYFRVRGNEVTNTIVSLVKQNYLATHTSSDPDVAIEFEILGTDYSNMITTECSFNELTVLNEEFGENQTLSIKSISFPLLSAAFASLTQAQLSSLEELNFGNNVFELASIDLITFVSDISKIVVNNDDDTIRLVLVDNVTTYIDVIEKTSGVPIVVSKEKPNFKCLWAKEIGS